MELENSQFRHLTKAESFQLIMGSVLMVVGIGCYVFMYHQLIAAAVFLTGSLLFAVQCFQIYNGKDITLRRLKGIMNMANLMFILAGILMLDTAMTYIAIQDPLGEHHRFISNMFTNWQTYVEFVYNKWLIPLIIAVVLELYSTHRISRELAKKSQE